MTNPIFLYRNYDTCCAFWDKDIFVGNRADFSFSFSFFFFCFFFVLFGNVVGVRPGITCSKFINCKWAAGGWGCRGDTEKEK
jgi:hypothetical protein